MKPVQIHTILIHCDTCGHEFPGEVNAWLGKPCPKCKAPDIITPTDVAYMRTIGAISDLASELLGDVPDDTPMQEVHFSSAGLRK